MGISRIHRHPGSTSNPKGRRRRTSVTEPLRSIPIAHTDLVNPKPWTERPGSSTASTPGASTPRRRSTKLAATSTLRVVPANSNQTDMGSHYAVERA